MPEWVTPSPGPNQPLDHGRRYSLIIHLPGIGKEDILVALHQDRLEILGRSRTEREEFAPGLEYYEAEEISAYHNIPLPVDADPSRAMVSLSDGEARIEIPSRLED